MKRLAVGLMLSMVVVAVAACSSSSGQDNGGSFSAPEPPDQWASGLTIGFIPVGFSFVWNEGHETAVFHTFQTEDGSEQLSVGVQISPPAQSGSGVAVARDGRAFVVYDEGTVIRVTEDVGNDTRIDVVSGSLDTDTLLQVAESVTYDHTYQPTNG